MGVFWINTPVLNSQGRAIGVTFEAPPCDSVEALTLLLQEKGIVCGNQLRTVDDGRGGKLVQSRRPMAITIKGIASILPYDFRVWEPEDAA